MVLQNYERRGWMPAMVRWSLRNLRCRSRRTHANRRQGTGHGESERWYFVWRSVQRKVVLPRKPASVPEMRQSFGVQREVRAALAKAITALRGFARIRVPRPE